MEDGTGITRTKRSDKEMNPANFEILFQDKSKVMLVDLGPWDQYPTITNAAEGVVETMAPMLNGRKLLYYDSDGELTELVVKDGRFAAFGIIDKKELQ